MKELTFEQAEEATGGATPVIIGRIILGTVIIPALTNEAYAPTETP